jgi:hypothetical protein
MTELEWHIETRQICDLKEYHKNPRTMTKKQYDHLKRNIKKFGLIDKPFINLDNTIIGGHQRINILRSMGHDQIELYVPSRELTEREVEELNYRHNENSGEWDFEMLANQYSMIDLMSWGESPLKEDKEEKDAKKIKPKVIFEFESESVMDEQATLIEEASMTWNAKMKIKK